MAIDDVKILQFQQFKAQGLTNEEAAKKAGFTPEELQAWEEFGGTPDAPVDDFQHETLPEARVVAKQKQKGKFAEWFEQHTGLAIGLGAVACVGVPALIGGAVGFLGGGVGAGAGALAGAKIGGVFAGLLGIASCSKFEIDPPEPSRVEGNTTNIYNNITIITKTATAEEIAQAIFNKFGGVLEDILAEIKNIKEGQDQNGDWLEKIFLELVAQHNDVKDIKELLKMFDLNISSVIELLKESNSNEQAILEAMANGNKEIQNLLNEILNAVKEGNEIGKNNGDILNLIFAKLQTLDPSRDADIIALLEKILGKVTDNVKATQDMDQNTQEKFNVVIDLITKLGSQGAAILDKVVELLEKGNAIGTRNGEVLDKILAALKNVKPGDESNVIALLEKILNKVTENVDATKDMDKKTQEKFDVVIDLITKLGSQGTAILDKIVELLEKGNAIGTRNGEVLDKILAALKNVKPGDESNVIALLEKILNKVTENVNATRDMDKKTQDNFSVVIELLGKLGADGDRILNAIVVNGEMTREQFESLKALVMKNNELTAKTNEWMAKLDANQKEIIERLKAFKPSGDPADLTEITNLLKNINDNVIKNGDTQTQILEKIEVLSLAVNQLVDVVGDNNKALLLQILNKIPHACECKPVDISEVIKILIEIKEKIEGGNHEGILEDLDDYFS